MIVAVGLDVIELARVRRVLQRHEQRFLERHFATEELAFCSALADPVPSLAARFAAKEAFQKCWFESHGWKDVWVFRAAARPQLRYAPAIADELDRRRWRAHLSLTHSRDHAAAVVVLEEEAGPAHE